MREHTKLRAFELADEVVLLIYRSTVGFPSEKSKHTIFAIFTYGKNPRPEDVALISPQRGLGETCIRQQLYG
jgi:hypothetical protein